MTAHVPFSRFRSLMSIAAAFMGLHPGTSIGNAIAMHGGYVSRGKGKGKSNCSPAGANGAFKRAATKARNVTKHRKMCRG